MKIEKEGRIVPNNLENNEVPSKNKLIKKKKKRYKRIGHLVILWGHDEYLMSNN